MYIDEAFWTVDTMFYSEMKIPHCAKYIFFAIKDIDFTRYFQGAISKMAPWNLKD